MNLYELASVLQNSIPQFDAARVKFIAVGVGTPDKASLFAEQACISETEILMNIYICLAQH